MRRDRLNRSDDIDDMVRGFHFQRLFYKATFNRYLKYMEELYGRERNHFERLVRGRYEFCGACSGLVASFGAGACAGGQRGLAWQSNRTFWGFSQWSYTHRDQLLMADGCWAMITECHSLDADR
jgi:hypothetical protein